MDRAPQSEDVSRNVAGVRYGLGEESHSGGASSSSRSSVVDVELPASGVAGVAPTPPDARPATSHEAVRGPSLGQALWGLVVGAEGALLDAAGLVGAVILSTLTIEDHHRLLFVALLLGVGWTCWLVAAQYRSLTTILTKQNPRLLLAPVFAPLVALVLQALARGYYSLSSLALYGAIWGCWMLVVRALGIRKQPPVSVLVPGSPAYLPALRRLPRVALITSSTPPATFKGIDVVITEPMEAYSVEWMQWFVHADLAGVRLLSAPLAMEHLTGRTPVESLWDRWAEGVLAGRSSYAAWKRLLDIGVVVLASPFLLVLAGAVCLIVLFSSGWPVLFVQERMGEGGVPFRMYKFRSMRTDAEHAGPAFASHGDPRVTPVGRLLRKFRLDELPQFWNVLKGEMSIIGPRPEQAGFSTMFEASLPHYGLRHVVRPGITGWAQVMQGYTTDETETTEKLRYDLYYVRHCSFLLDLEIVVRTTGIVFTGFGSR